MKLKYYTPLSVSILKGVAWFLTVAGLVALFPGIATHDPYTTGVGLGCLLCGLLYFVLAGVRDATERTAFHTERMAQMMERTETEREVAAAAEKYGAPSRTTRRTQIPIDPALRMAAAFDDAESKPSRSGRFYVQYPSGDQAGPLDVVELQKLLNVGKITVETLVIREGEEEWQPLAMFISSPD